MGFEVSDARGRHSPPPPLEGQDVALSCFSSALDVAMLHDDNELSL